jgi:hypothetical protein
VAGGLFGRIRELLAGRQRSEPRPAPEDPRRDAAQRLEAARTRLKQEIPPPEDDGAPTP